MNIIARRFLLMVVGIAIFLLIHSLLASYVLERYRQQRVVAAAEKKAPESSLAKNASVKSAEKAASKIARLNY